MVENLAIAGRLAAECPGAWTEVLLAPDSATVFSEDRGTICTHETGPVLEVRFGCRAQCCQYIGGRLRANPREQSRSSKSVLGHEPT